MPAGSTQPDLGWAWPPVHTQVPRRSAVVREAAGGPVGFIPIHSARLQVSLHRQPHGHRFVCRTPLCGLRSLLLTTARPMAASPPWFSWLAGLVSSVWSGPPAPGTHEAGLEERRAGALLSKELRKPAGQRDEELVHALRVKYRSIQLRNLQVRRPPPRPPPLQAAGGAARSSLQQLLSHTPPSCMQREASYLSSACTSPPCRPRQTLTFARLLPGSSPPAASAAQL